MLYSAVSDRRPLYLAADGNQKLNHHANCGKTITAVHEEFALKPLLHEFFHPAVHAVAESVLMQG
jgi:hypothetical protein